MTEPHELVAAALPARAIAEELPEAVAHAVIDLITGPLLEDPYGIGRELRRELQGVFAARRGTDRVLYRVDETRRDVTVVRIDHRRDVHHGRPRCPSMASGNPVSSRHRSAAKPA